MKFTFFYNFTTTPLAHASSRIATATIEQLLIDISLFAKQIQRHLLQK